MDSILSLAFKPSLLQAISATPGLLLLRCGHRQWLGCVCTVCSWTLPWFLFCHLNSPERHTPPCRCSLREGRRHRWVRNPWHPLGSTAKGQLNTNRNHIAYIIHDSFLKKYCSLFVCVKLFKETELHKQNLKVLYYNWNSSLSQNF